MTSAQNAAAGASATTGGPRRKRRRRTSGAPDDCFACRKRAVACDRKRPYCTPCIAMGKACEGYRQTLTWGVGVASRGKLRGLSCPVPVPAQSSSAHAGNHRPAPRRPPPRREPSPAQARGGGACDDGPATVPALPVTGHDEVMSSSMADWSSTNLFHDLDGRFQQDDDDDPKALPLWDSRFRSPFSHLSPRLQSLMEHYDRHVCTYLVAFDGSHNPYRSHVLQLAMHNEGLQNAIAALATNNMRMRRRPPPTPMGFVEEIPDAFDASSTPHAVNEPSPEELCYKQTSIGQLNQQLTDSRGAQDDSVLATLLILCLFHVCDSGFSKFKTQLAGVQKLLSLRDRATPSDFTGWVEMFFIWFDVMTSAVNDREMQIQSESLDMLDCGAGPAALEQFSGCDGRLFKLIARLGRLNLLSQGRAVRGHPLHRRSTSHNPDRRHEFWTEWKDVRARLQAWTMDSSSMPPPTDTTTTTTAQAFPLAQRDMLHINESYRASALLYTQRLASPLLPSSHPDFQQHVSAGLGHIAALATTSPVHKFLLWPLFILGTECVHPPHRRLVRHRCIAVHRESGFWNNITGLHVLERVWRDRPTTHPQPPQPQPQHATAHAHATEPPPPPRQPFAWRNAMHRVDGEYIVI